ncbi:hypothetical protein KORDIASMS9_01063 [Kordia sp. SMS9]|nr:hypothetical protein KORDIASMS9_01063 [Kordia sp. SMS9]
MKKRKLKNLSLNKSKVSNLKPVIGGKTPRSFNRTECDPCSPSEQTLCLVCNQTLPQAICATFLECTEHC